MNLSQLRAMARAEADEQSTGFIGDAELDTFINRGFRYVYSKLITQFQDYFIVKGTVGNGGLITVVSGTNEYSLPTTHQKLVRVERRDSNDTNENNWRILERNNIGNDQMNDYYPVREGRDLGFGYFIAGNKIFLRPVPSSGFHLRLWFIPRLTELTATTDEPSIPVEYHELIASYASIMCLKKSGESIWRENMEHFQIDLENLISSSLHRVHSPEQMIVTDDSDYYTGGSY
jgi:hypothetical protein